MRTLRIAGAAAAAILASTAFVGSASAKDGFYIAPSLGWVLPNSIDITDGADTGTADFDNGWAFYAGAGYRFGQFRVEGELGYGELSGGEVSAGGETFSFDADQTLFSGTLAGYVDFDVQAFTPYVGAGAGFITADVDGFSIDGEELEGFSGSDTSFMMFGEAGAAFAVSDTISIVPSYRYMWVNDGGDGVDDTTAHVVRVGLRYGF